MCYTNSDIIIRYYELCYYQYVASNYVTANFVNYVIADVTTAMSLPTKSLQIMLLPTWDYDYQSWIYSLSSKLVYVHHYQLCHSLLCHC